MQPADPFADFPDYLDHVLVGFVMIHEVYLVLGIMVLIVGRFGNNGLDGW